MRYGTYYGQNRWHNDLFHHNVISAPPFSLDTVSSLLQRFAARISGLASGLVLAVRPTGSAEVPGAQGWVPKIVSAKRVETIFGCP